MGDYKLICLEDGKEVPEKYTLMCPEGHKSLIRTEYREKKFNPGKGKGIFRFSDWLPVHSTFRTESGPVTFVSEKLSKELGLSDLRVAFTGYYPERGAVTTSCSFKEMEAFPTYARAQDNGGGTMLLASAGNTARAFAQVAADTGNKCIIVVPERSDDRVCITKDTGNVKVIAVKGDYSDAIRVCDRINAFGGFVSEGGARNVARRDGMGTVMLQGADDLGRIPDRYFQAVGSGTGGISAYEASMRLIGDGRFGDKLPVLELSQNLPFAPMAKAWNEGRRDITPEDLGKGREDIAEVWADVLTNRTPPYSMKGGLYDAMTACNGRFRMITNAEARSAEKLWMGIENVRPDPAASVALASLIKAVENDEVGKDDCILLNMTGGGLDRAKEELSLVTIRPCALFDTDVPDEELREVAHV